jgi:single-stranded-DNA-specific exonuclease
MMFKYASKKKLWQVREGSAPPESVRFLSEKLGILPATAKLLSLRGYSTPETARAFIEKETELLHDPFLLKDMDKAVDRIRLALIKREKIVVYGDYDVDGVTSVTILYSYLRIHSSDVSYYIPNRVGEGYGLNIDAIRSFAADGATLMITVDTGITAIEEIAAAKELGIDTVVTDHHECRPELPDCAAVINPRRPDCQYPFKELAGVGVAFKLICALEQNLRSTSMYNAVKFATRRCAEFVAVGTIADVMPLVDENRIIVSYGLKLLENTSNVGLRALMNASGVTDRNPDGSFSLKKKITSSLVGFTLAPRINAAGRISNATFAVELFLTEYANRADEIASELCEINRRRQAQENLIIEQSDKKIAEQCLPDDYVIVLDDDHWHHGVIGIVCSRLTERYNLPSIIISFEGQNENSEPSDSDIGKGSGRSVKGLNLVEALGVCASSLVKYGGHELAAGLSIERSKLPEFRRMINKYAAEIFDGREPERTVDIDMLLEPSEISMRLVNEIYLLEPFGVSNMQPVFETDRFVIKEIIPLANRRHTRLTVRGDDRQFTALCFGMPTDDFGFNVGDVVDLVYNLDINEFKNQSNVQLIVKDIRRSAIASEVTVPTREDFAKLYLLLKSRYKAGQSSCSLESLADAVSIDCDTASLMLDVFDEMGIVSLTRSGRDVCALPLPVKSKIRLEESKIYARLKSI